MLVHSISFMQAGVDTSLYYEASEAIKSLQYYFKKFNGADYEEAMSRTLNHILTHFNGSKLSSSDIKPYVKKLARTILQEPRRDIPTDFIEDTTIENKEHSFEPNANTVNLGSISDFSNDVVDRLYCDAESLNLMFKFMLLNLEEYKKFCLELKDGGRQMKGYSPEFRANLYKLAKVVTDLTAKLLELYDLYESEINTFLGCELAGIWYEADYNLIAKSTSKRVKVLQKGYDKNFDMDYNPYCVNGRRYIESNNKHIYKVRYIDFWEQMCDMLDSDVSNRMKCILGEYTIVKTCGGSISVLNPDLFTIYDLVRDELLTNLLRDTSYKLIGVGSKNFYILGDTNYNIPCRFLNGIRVQFELVDITDSVEMLR